MIALLLALSLEHAAAAELAGVTYGIQPALLLAIAEHETRWDSSLINGYACGPMQVATVDPDRCAAMGLTLIGYLEGARELRGRLRIARGDMRAALRLYGCGWDKDDAGEIIRPAQIPATCNGFDSYVIAHGALIARKLGKRATT